MFPSDHATTPIRRVLTAVAGALVLTVAPPDGPADAAAQDRASLAEIVSKEVAVSRDEATLRVELDDGEEIEVRFEDGRVFLFGEDAGAYDERLETAWRELLGRAVALDDGPLARALVEWEPPEGAEGETADLYRRLDRAFEDPLREPVPTADRGDREPSDIPSVVIGLLTRSERLAELAVAVEELDLDDFEFRLDRDVVVGQGEEIEGSLLVVDGDVELQGEVDGHVVVVGGTLRTFEGSVVRGDVRVADGRLVRNGGTVEGDVLDIGDSALDARLRERLGNVDERIREAEARAREAEERVREARRIEVRMQEDRDAGIFSPVVSFVGHLVGAGAELLQTVVTLLVLSVLGGLAVLLGRQNLEVVADTARRNPGRSAAVGLAGAFLTLPVWILGIVALCITIVGIPVAVAWIPLFPLAVVVAAALGYFAVAHNTGEWLARQRYPYLGWIRRSNPYTLVVGGVLGLLGAFLLADLVNVLGSWLNFLEGMLMAAGIVVTVGAALVGFGAVLLTRAGRRPEYYGGVTADPFDDEWPWDPTAPETGSGSSPAGGAEEEEGR